MLPKHFVGLLYQYYKMFYALDIIGTLAFAISGALTAINKKLDLFGVLTIAFVTAVGGGTLRDVLTGSTPVAWMLSLNHVYAILLGFVLSALFWRRLEKLRVSLFLFDTIGLGVFTLIGIEKGLIAALHPVICVALGTMTACFGGVIRDILCNEIPVLFRRETFYATVCIFGGIVFFALRKTGLNIDVIYGASAALIIVFRLLAVKYKWYLPVLKAP